MGSYFDEIMNRDMDSLVSNMPSLPTTDITKMNIGSSVSSDKVFQSVSTMKTTSNVFGVFDSKQVVQELSADISNPFSNETLSSIQPEKLQSTVSKLKTEIISDSDYSSAVDAVMSNVSELKQTAFSSTDGLFVSSKDMLSSMKDELSLDTSFLQNISLDTVTADIIPSNMAITDFESLKSMFNGPNGLGNFNTCDALRSALAWGNQLLNPMALAGLLGSLFGILGKYDITGIMNCLSQAQSSLNYAQRIDLGNTLVGNGAIGSYGEYLGLGNSGISSNPYDTIKTLGARAQVSSISNNTYMDDLFSGLGVSQRQDVYNAKNYNTTQNHSVLDNVDYPVYDRNSMIEAQNNNFLSNCFDDDTDKLITQIPERIFI